MSKTTINIIIAILVLTVIAVVGFILYKRKQGAKPTLHTYTPGTDEDNDADQPQNIKGPIPMETASLIPIFNVPERPGMASTNTSRPGAF